LQSDVDVAETISATTTIELAVPDAYVGAIIGVQVCIAVGCGANVKLTALITKL
jgi:hypothetical protein